MCWRSIACYSCTLLLLLRNQRVHGIGQEASYAGWQLLQLIHVALRLLMQRWQVLQASCSALLQQQQAAAGCFCLMLCCRALF
jgi:hypothetical protein